MAVRIANLDEDSSPSDQRVFRARLKTWSLECVLVICRSERGDRNDNVHAGVTLFHSLFQTCIGRSEEHPAHVANTTQSHTVV